MRQRKLALVVGSAHLDILCESNAGYSEHLDKPGKISFALGGTAFNIALYLSEYYSVSLVTAIPKGSLASDPIRMVCKSKGIKLFLAETESNTEPAFVAHYSDGDLQSAVTATTVDGEDIKNMFLRLSRRFYNAIVLDCNLPTDTLAYILNALFENSNKQSPPKIFISGVSQHKASRIAQAASICRANNPFYVASVNELEFKYITNMPDLDELDSGWISDVCNRFGACYLMITRGGEGHKMLSASGKSCNIQAPKIDGVISTAGAGDALLSGLISHVLEEGDIDQYMKNSHIHKFVYRALTTSGTNAISEPTMLNHVLGATKIWNYKRNRPGFFGVIVALYAALSFVSNVGGAFQAASQYAPLIGQYLEYAKNFLHPG